MPRTLNQNDLHDSNLLHIGASCAATALADEVNQRVELVGRKVSVIRVLVYEGEGGEVLDQLARSLPVGVKRFTGNSISIRVLQRAIIDHGAYEPPIGRVGPGLSLEQELALLNYVNGDHADDEALETAIQLLRARTAEIRGAGKE